MVQARRAAEAYHHNKSGIKKEELEVRYSREYHPRDSADGAVPVRSTKKESHGAPATYQKLGSSSDGNEKGRKL